MADPTKIRGFRNVSTTTQARFLSDDGRVEIRQGRGGRWSVFPLGGTAFEVRGREAAIRAARGGREGERSGDSEELYLYATNEGDLYREYTKPVQAELAARKGRGMYRREDAVALFLPMVNKAAERWNREFGRDPDARRSFPPAVRRAAAKDMAEHFEVEYDLGNMGGGSGTKTPATIERDVKQIVEGGSHASPTVRRDAYPNDLVAGDVVVRRDIKGRKKYRVSHTGHSGEFVQVYTREVGGGSGGFVTFDRSQLKMV